MLLKTLPSSSSSSSIAAGHCCFTPILKLPAPPCGLHCSRVPFSLRASAMPEPAASSTTLTGVVFRPFQEVQTQLQQVPPSSTQSLARQRYSAACESAVNEQINVEYNASYVYHTLFAYFDRDNVALPGLARFFKENSDEEREHAEKIMKYQNIRGGHVKLQSILMPSITEFDDEEKGDALYAMEFTLALEKLVNEKLLNLHKVATEERDAQLTDFIEGELLKPQVEDIKKVSQYVSQLRRVGKGHGVYHFDLQLQEDLNGAAA